MNYGLGVEISSRGDREEGGGFDRKNLRGLSARPPRNKKPNQKPQSRVRALLD